LVILHDAKRVREDRKVDEGLRVVGQESEAKTKSVSVYASENNKYNKLKHNAVDGLI